MGRSIIEEIEESERIKRKKALKKKKEQENVMSSTIETDQGKLTIHADDRVPEIKNPITNIMMTDESGSEYDSLPQNFRTKVPAAQPQVPTMPQQSIQRPVMVQSSPINELIEKSSKDQLFEFFTNVIRNGTIIYLPGLNPGKFKFVDYGYRRLLELLIEKEDFRRIFIDIENVQGMNFVKISKFIRPKDDPRDLDDEKIIRAENLFRGLEVLCDVLTNGTTVLDPYENEWKHLNKLLDQLTQAGVTDRKRAWRIETEKAVLNITSENTGEEIEYSAKIGSR